MSSANRLLLDYHSVTLYAADVSTLAPHTWLNDNILSFWMDYLQHEVHAAQSERFRFVSPTTTMILMHEEDPTDFSDTFEGCDVTPLTELVFFPLNDTTALSGQAGGGKHWTLLVLDVARAQCVAYDSMGSGKKAGGPATKLAKALAPLLPKLAAARAEVQQAGASSSSSSAASAPASSSLICGPTPQQSNGSDCGMYTLSLAEHIAALRVQHPSLALDSREYAAALVAQLSPQEITKKRAAIKALIMERAKKAGSK